MRYIDTQGLCVCEYSWPTDSHIIERPSKPLKDDRDFQEYSFEISKALEKTINLLHDVDVDVPPLSAIPFIFVDSKLIIVISTDMISTLNLVQACSVGGLELMAEVLRKPIKTLSNSVQFSCDYQENPIEGILCINVNKLDILSTVLQYTDPGYTLSIYKKNDAEFTAVVRGSNLSSLACWCSEFLLHCYTPQDTSLSYVKEHFDVLVKTIEISDALEFL